MAANWFGYSIKILSIFVLGRFRERLFAARQSQGQTSHCGQTHSCLQSDAKIHTASSVRTKSCDDSACPSLGVINAPCVQLAEMLDYPSPLAVLLESLERKGVRLDESDLNDLDITNKNHYVVVIGGKSAEFLSRLYERLESGATAQEALEYARLVFRRPDFRLLDVKHLGVIHKSTQSDAKNQGLSNAKKVDAPTALADPLNSCQNNQNPNTQSKSDGARMSPLLVLLWLSIGIGGFHLQSALVLQHTAPHGWQDCREVEK